MGEWMIGMVAAMAGALAVPALTAGFPMPESGIALEARGHLVETVGTAAPRHEAVR